jgi:pimeloyl-ACP methyl ester carboxylesterase
VRDTSINQNFYKLLDNTLAEVRRRDPAYPSCFPINLSHAARLTQRYRRHPLFDRFPPASIEQALTEGVSHLGRLWPSSENPTPLDDPLLRVLCDSIVDSFCADQGLLTLMPYSSSNGSVSGVLAEGYNERRVPGGPSYFVRKDGREPLLLINASGTPIAIWKHFLADSTHDFKVIVPCRRGSDLLHGGLKCHTDIRTECADCVSILESESLERVSIVAWCNGARVGIELANARPDRVSSLVLMGPMLKGIQGVSPSITGFDRDLQPLLDAVRDDPGLAPLLSKSISQQAKLPDWGKWRNAPSTRGRALFALPAKDQACGMLGPLSDSESFINIARRVKSDEDYPMHRALANLRARTMVILGSDDQIVSNELLDKAVRRLCRNPVLKIVLSGSGHYIQDLQYHYFRFLLNEFVLFHRSPPCTARVLVEELSSAEMHRSQSDGGLK